MFRFTWIIFGLIALTGCANKNNSGIIIHYPGNSAHVEYAISEIRTAINCISFPDKVYINFLKDPELEKQAFKIAKSRDGILIAGGDETGLMYGGLELAEDIRINGALPDLSEPIQQAPFIKQRGLKFNIPLDIRTPSYQDAGDSAQNNILEMWNFDFWKAYFDRMAKNRYNVLTLWNPHPFPSMIKLQKYPDIALEDVCGTTFPLDKDRTDESTAQFIAGCGVSQQVLDHLTVLKKMSMDEKIEFWRKVMRYAKNRGVEIYFITWNIKLNSVAPPGWYREQQLKMGNEGKYGINNDQENPRTIAYLRESVREFLLTYPDVAGIGVTAGENMEDRNDEYDREKWLWKTYGEGIMDAKKQQPQRDVKFIHRFWQSGVDRIVNDFASKYPDSFDLSFKYARARMYATPAPRWADEYIGEIRKYGLKSWWNIRNDDIFFFRWGDADYASAFIKNLPPQDVTAGYFMGSDGYVWGREFTSKHPQSPRELEIDKHWYNFMLWGRMGYNPDLKKETIHGLLSLHYPGIDVDRLSDAWTAASRIPSLVTQFHWHDWDYRWAVEGCLDLPKGFHTIEDFITNPSMEGAGILTIPEYVNLSKEKKSINGITPLQIADNLDSLADDVITYIAAQQAGLGKVSDSFDELIYDLKAWAFMGKYYADKIRGAYYLYAFKQGLGQENREKSIYALQEALAMWKEYANAATRNYEPQFLAKTRTVDWQALTEDVKKDIELVRK
jgi:hypothetical protein